MLRLISAPVTYSPITLQQQQQRSIMTPITSATYATVPTISPLDHPPPPGYVSIPPMHPHILLNEDDKKRFSKESIELTSQHTTLFPAQMNSSMEAKRLHQLPSRLPFAVDKRLCSTHLPRTERNIRLSDVLRRFLLMDLVCIVCQYDAWVYTWYADGGPYWTISQGGTMLELQVTEKPKSDQFSASDPSFSDHSSDEESAEAKLEKVLAREQDAKDRETRKQKRKQAQDLRIATMSSTKRARILSAKHRLQLVREAKKAVKLTAISAKLSSISARPVFVYAHTTQTIGDNQGMPWTLSYRLGSGVWVGIMPQSLSIDPVGSNWALDTECFSISLNRLGIGVHNLGGSAAENDDGENDKVLRRLLDEVDSIPAGPTSSSRPPLDVQLTFVPDLFSGALLLCVNGTRLPVPLYCSTELSRFRPFLSVGRARNDFCCIIRS